MKDLKKIIEIVNDKLTDFRNLNPEYDSQSVTITDGHHLYEVYINSKNEKEVSIMNPKNYMRFYENVCKYIEDNMIDWDEIEVEEYDEWDDHGFASESDYLQYRYG